MAIGPTLGSSDYLEQVECWVKDPLDNLLQELLEDAVLVDTRLVHPKVTDKLDADHTFHGVLGQLSKLLIAVLPETEDEELELPV